MALEAIGNLISERRLLLSMTARDFRSKYAGSLMGVFWTIITPLLLLAIFTFIFAVVFKARFGGEQKIQVSALYILAGILPWLAFQDGLIRSATVVIENKNLVTRARFPLSVLPAYPALSALGSQLIGTLVLTIAAISSGRFPGASLIALPLLLALQLALAIGLAWIIAALSVYLRDVVHALPILLLVLMYATPVFYPAEMVPDRFKMLMMANPVAHLIGAYRRVLLEAAWPDPFGISVLAAFALAALIIGSVVFQRLCRGFADKL